jgi:16S rRNA G966 N2-methylase RsmD
VAKDKVLPVVHINYAISPQAHTHMYLMHKYWARKPHNVVGEYIEHYSKEGDIILDPFAGSGVTAIEALKRGRKAVAIDLDPMSTFITRMTLIPANLKTFKASFEEITETTKTQIQSLYSTVCPICKKKGVILATIWQRDKNKPFELRLYCPKCKKRTKKKPSKEDLQKLDTIEKMEIPYWYPKDVLQYSNSTDFMKKETAGDIPHLFTKRNLIALSILWNAITAIKDSEIRDLHKFAFTSCVHLASKMCPVAKPGPHSHWSKFSATSFWALQSYWVPPIFMESNVWMLFESAILGKQGVLKGKEESNETIPNYKEAKTFDDLKGDSNVLIVSQSALSLKENPAKISSECVDYVFTDPPYGGSVQYGELTVLWLSWLKGENNDRSFRPRFNEEVTINDAQKKDFDYYHKMLKASFEQVYDVLKCGKWLTVTFHNTDIKIYNSIIKAVVLSGFDLEKVIYQPPARASAKGLLQPYGSAIGDYYIRFRKPEKKEDLLSESEIDKERYERIVVDTVKHVIAVRREPVAFSIIINSYPVIFEALKKNGYPFSAPEGIEEVLKNHLGKEFILENVTNEKGKVLGKKWWLKEKLFLDRASLSERVEETVIAVLNRRVVASFEEILKELFTTFQNSLTPDTQSVKEILEEYAEKTPDKRWQLKKIMRVRQSQHNQIVKMLADLGEKAGFQVYADIPEYRNFIFNLPLSKDRIDRMREIDVLWLKQNNVVYEFEVENSTGISDAIIRGSNIPSEVKRYIVIPEEREKLLLMKMSEPLLKENIEHYKWSFIYYKTFLSFYEENHKRKTLDAQEIDKLAEIEIKKKPEQSTMSQFTSGNLI